jgi:hypothetical protein
MNADKRQNQEIMLVLIGVHRRSSAAYTGFAA